MHKYSNQSRQSTFLDLWRRVQSANSLHFGTAQSNSTRLPPSVWCGSLAAFVFLGVLKVKINQTAINCGAFGNMGNSIRSSNVKGFKRCVCYLSINVSIYAGRTPPQHAYILSDEGQQQQPQQTTPDDASFGLLEFSTLVKPKSQVRLVCYARQTMRYPLNGKCA